jgi:hypothetical protein
MRLVSTSRFPRARNDWSRIIDGDILTNRRKGFKLISSQTEALMREYGCQLQTLLAMLVEMQYKHAVLTREKLDDIERTLEFPRLSGI